MSRDASRDLDRIIVYLSNLPSRPGIRIGKELQAMFDQIADWPKLGLAYQPSNSGNDYEMRSRITGN